MSYNKNLLQIFDICKKETIEKSMQSFTCEMHQGIIKNR